MYLCPKPCGTMWGKDDGMIESRRCSGHLEIYWHIEVPEVSTATPDPSPLTNDAVRGLFGLGSSSSPQKRTRVP